MCSSDLKMLAGVAANMEGAFEIEADVTPDANGIAGIEISRESLPSPAQNSERKTW